ncbi:MAG TPA: deoxyguanosinetriphosphate triphosphohydrolase [Thermodesulfobacteriota bacterium]|nr:deoxyguanosinetriphosphate triphosphohydrolase [Thermodesulfobacteriota bacterium]HQO78700.1 deoxyguanosinetriphosphate triphosphohydrolase [Thermodesulfobacteriota bacterium]
MPAPQRTDLASYAAKDEESRGRRYQEDYKDDRPAFERDRDRIIHCAAFRRLEYKTQVFVNHEGDYYRTRLTHSLEVSQIARGIARRLGLNQELTETIALAHDLGHTPFGHSGEVVLNELMKDHGGFEHNLQSLRVVEKLEERYPGFDGLNLTWETREGLAKHTTFHDGGQTIPVEYEPDRLPTMEAQIIELADEIAYNNHDIDDGLESGLIEEEALRREVDLWADVVKRTEKKYPGIDDQKRTYFSISSLIGFLILDLVAETRKNLEQRDIRSLEDVRKAGQRMVAFSNETQQRNQQLKNFLMENLYNHYRVKRMSRKSKMIITRLFTAYREGPMILPKKQQQKMQQESKERIICDYIAGMTDRYAQDEYRKLFDPFARV